jgi:hypothetical protein
MAKAFFNKAGKPKIQRPEQKLQMACVEWFDYQYSHQQNRLYMNNNSSASKNITSKKMGGINKAMGVRRGVSDLTYLLPNGKACFIELKSPVGRQSIEQKAFAAMVTELGNDYHIARDIYEFMGIINSYNS